MCKLYVYHTSTLSGPTQDMIIRNIILTNIRNLIEIIKEKNKYNIKIDKNFTDIYCITKLEKYIKDIEFQVETTSIKHKLSSAIKHLQQSNDIKILF
jgi:hypothetical protein